MNLFPKFLERNNVFEKLREGSDESIINVCNSIMSFVSNGSLRGSQPTMCIDEILMLFLEYMSLSTESTSYYGIKSVLLCIESIAKLNKKYEDCVLQTGLVGAIVDLLQTNNKTNDHNNDTIGTQIGLIIARILSHLTTSDKRSCLIFRLHHGIHSLITFIERNHNTLVQTKQHSAIVEYALNIIHHCVDHSEHAAMQLFESNGLEMCLEVLITAHRYSSLLIKQSIDLIHSICRASSNAKVNHTFIKANGLRVIIDYLCKTQTTNTPQSKANIIKLLQLISTLCCDAVCAKALLSSSDGLSRLYPFLLANAQINEDIKCVSAQLLNHILRHGMKDMIQTQSIELYKFNQTHTKIQIKKNATHAEDTECIAFPELEPLRKRKATRQQMINELECAPKTLIPFVTQPPLHAWSRLLPSDLKKAKANAQLKNKKRNKKRHSVPSNTFNKSTFSTRRRKSVSFIVNNNNNKSLNNARSSTSLLVKTVTSNASCADKPLPRASSKEVTNHKQYVTTSWIKKYYTHTTASYLERMALPRGEPLSVQPSNLIIKLLYEQIRTKSAFINHAFTPKIIYDRNELLANNRLNLQNKTTLEFESRFECGNLHRVIQTGPVEYDLLVSTDYNCNRHRQWFYFRVKNMKQNVEYKFNIVNLDKNDSVFNRGCKPTLYSTKRFNETGVGWTRANTSETYYYSNAHKNGYQPKYKEIEALSNSSSLLHIQNSSEMHDDHLSTPQKTTTKHKKASSLNNSAKRKLNTRDCHSERLSGSKAKSMSSSCSTSASSLISAPTSRSLPVKSLGEDDSESIEPMTRSNYKQIRKQRARLRNKKLCQTQKEKHMTESMDSNYTNLLHRENSLSFEIKNSKRKKRRHVIPSIPSIAQSKKDETQKYHFTLTFTIRFPHTHDTCFVSYFYPFSYSDLQGMLNVLSISPITNFERQLLCRSRLGNRVDLLTITNFNSGMNVIRDRAVVILSSRVHPGEVNASWIMKGIIDFLLSKNTVACELRNRFVFKIVPCLNPDGVIGGNYRCSLSGVDLNRQYLNASQQQHPSIFHLKRLVSSIHSKIFLICDVHGHSRMMNATLYGCSPDNRATAETTDRYKLFAFLLAERAPDMFSYDQCIWNITKQKEATARVVFWRQFNIQNTFTLESTFCGSDLNYNVKGFHFTVDHYLAIGAKFCAALYDIASQSNESKLKIQNAFKSMQKQSTDQNNNNKKKLRMRIRKMKRDKMT